MGELEPESTMDAEGDAARRCAEEVDFGADGDASQSKPVHGNMWKGQRFRHECEDLNVEWILRGDVCLDAQRQDPPSAATAATT
eukprot:s3630_g6.t1